MFFVVLFGLAALFGSYRAFVPLAIALAGLVAAWRVSTNERAVRLWQHLGLRDRRDAARRVRAPAEATAPGSRKDFGAIHTGILRADAKT